MKECIREIIRRHKIVAILRGIAPQHMAAVIAALYDGGIRILEITYDQQRPENSAATLAAIRAARDRYKERLTIGAGTVLTAAETKAAAAAGAQFVLSPSVAPAVLHEAKQSGVAAIPGALTPTEIAAAYDGGAALVKLFPAGELGLAYCRAVMAPLSQVPLIAVGGINLDNVADYIQSGFIGVGLGAALTPPKLITAGDYQGLEQLAAQYVEKIRRTTDAVRYND